MKTSLSCVYGWLSRTHNQFLVIALVFGTLFAYLTPPLWGADERAHFARAYQISKGQVIQNQVTIDGKASAGGSVPESFIKLDNLVTDDITDNAQNAYRQVDSYRAYMNISDTTVSSEKIVANNYGAIIYPAITYIAPVAGMLVAEFFDPSALTLLYSARIATLIAYIALVFLSLYVLRHTSVKWIVFVIALLPMSIYNASIVTADSILLAFSLVFVSFLYIISQPRQKITQQRLTGLVISGVILTIIKPPYVILILPLLLLPLKNAASRRLRYLVKFGVPIFCIVIAGLCVLAESGVISTPPASLGNIDAVAQLSQIIHNPIRYVYMLVNSITTIDFVPQMIGLFGTSFIFIPGIISDALLVTLVISMFTKESEEKGEFSDKKTGLLYVLAGILVSVAVITTLYLTWTPVGGLLVAGVQGRYFLPVMAFVVIGIRIYLKQRLSIKQQSLTWGYPSVMTACLVISVLWYYKILY